MTSFPAAAATSTTPEAPSGALYAVRQVWAANDLEAVRDLADVAFACSLWNVPAGGRVTLYPQFDMSPQTVVLVAERNDRVIGTVSIVMDGTLGLPVDRHFPCETHRLRRGGKPLAAVYRLATDPDLTAGDRAYLALDLLAWAVATGFETQRSEAVVSTVPAHLEPVYRRIAGADVVARAENLVFDGIAGAALLMCVLPGNMPAAFAEQVMRCRALLSTPPAAGSRRLGSVRATEYGGDGLVRAREAAIAA